MVNLKVSFMPISSALAASFLTLSKPGWHEPYTLPKILWDVLYRLLSDRKQSE